MSQKMSQEKIRIGIAGATGYTGNLLARLLLNHPEAEIKALYSSKHIGKKLESLDPYFLGFDLPLMSSLEEDLQNNKIAGDIDCLFTATPNGMASDLLNSSSLGKLLLDGKLKLIDLAADFRLKDKNIFEDYYSPLKIIGDEYLNISAYGLTEHNRDKIKKAQIVANPGCYPTASALPIIPLLKANLIDNSLCIVDAKSGVSGAGKKAEESLLFSEITESFSAYKIDKHRHTPEIEQSLSLFAGQNLTIKFTPHLVPMKRGILATVYLKPSKSESINSTFGKVIQSCLLEEYSNEQFIHVVSEPPKTKDVYGTNRCHIYPYFDQRSGLIVLVSAIDNLMKGASGQALQNFNLLFGFEEKLGF
ncbi:MAG: N-acetyl-gamma-glutamyl-phosphate reductase [Candidatus Melainabacteria bacterium]|jgi:N-acetyl-gamma-glutamyl-phosphate reductase